MGLCRHPPCSRRGRHLRPTLRPFELQLHGRKLVGELLAFLAQIIVLELDALMSLMSLMSLIAQIIVLELDAHRVLDLLFVVLMAGQLRQLRLQLRARRLKRIALTTARRDRRFGRSELLAERLELERARVISCELELRA